MLKYAVIQVLLILILIVGEVWLLGSLRVSSNAGADCRINAQGRIVCDQAPTPTLFNIVSVSSSVVEIIGFVFPLLMLILMDLNTYMYFRSNPGLRHPLRLKYFANNLMLILAFFLVPLVPSNVNGFGVPEIGTVLIIFIGIVAYNLVSLLRFVGIRHTGDSKLQVGRWLIVNLMMIGIFAFGMLVVSILAVPDQITLHASNSILPQPSAFGGLGQVVYMLSNQLRVAWAVLWATILIIFNFSVVVNVYPVAGKVLKYIVAFVLLLLAVTFMLYALRII